MNELPPTSQPEIRRGVCVVLASSAEQRLLDRCLESIRSHSPRQTTVLSVGGESAAELNRAVEQLAPADVVLLQEPCLVSDGWLARLREAARSDTNIATASALADAGTELALTEPDRSGDGSEAESEDDPAQALGGDPPMREGALEPADRLAAHTLRLRPRLTRAVGPCTYMRRDGLELVGALDERLDLRSALELDFAQRCLLSGLAHVAADDVVVQRLLAEDLAGAPELSSGVLERYPYLSDTPLAESGVLQHALRAARGPQPRLWVTLDVRALDGAVTGTQVHILELIRALARTGALRMRLLVWAERIDRQTLKLLGNLPATELLAAEEVEPSTPSSTVFHRPQQAFSPGDTALALALGERVVLSQLDLIAYRNPGYFADASAWADYRRASRHGLSAAERVVVFSDHTRRELLDDALVDDARVKVVPPGLDHRGPDAPRPPAALVDQGGEPRVERGEQLPADGFLLCLGTDFRHKNRVFALRLLASLRAQHGWQGSLVLAGTHIAHGSSLELERAFMREHDELRESVVKLGAIDEPEKAWLLAHAQAVVYPSAYEGFGLVPFESALNGVPCVFAAQSSLAEAAPEGTATILQWDAEQSATAAYALLSDPKARARQVSSLADAARGLTWDAAASRMVEIYREAAAAPVRDAAMLSRDAVERERMLTEAHRATVEMLIGERELVLADYDALIEQLGPGRGLIGTQGSLPEDVQRALLALSARPAIGAPLFSGVARVFALTRGLSRVMRRTLERGP